MSEQQPTHDALVATAIQPPLALAIRDRVIPALFERHGAPLPETAALVEALLVGGSGQDQVDQARACGAGFDTLMLCLLTPAARALDDYWISDRGSFATVTLATWRLRTLMRRVADDLAPVPVLAPRAILISTLPGEQHDFGAAMVAEFFGRDGWRAQHARPASVADLVEDIRGGAPDVLGLSIGRVEALPELRQTIAAVRLALRRKAPAILVGGAALLTDATIAARSGADGFSLCAATALREAARLFEQRTTAFPAQPPRKERFVGLPNPRGSVSGPGSADHRATSRGRG